MVKRLTDTEIWNKDWYLDLSIKKKLLLKYIFDNCDCAGVYEISYRNLRNCFNEEVTKEDFENIKMIKFFDENKIIIEDFIKLQYGVDINGLKPRNSVHKGVLRCLEKHKLLLNPFETVKNKDKNKNKNKNKNKDKNKDIDKDKNQQNDFDIKNNNNCINSDMEINNKSDIKVINDIKNNINNMNNSIKNDNSLTQDNNFDIKNHNNSVVKDKFNDLKSEMLKEYTKLCPHLIKLTGEAKSKRTDEKIRLYLNETNFDMDSYKELCRKADRLRRIGTIGIDFETMLNCRIGIMNGKYKDPKQTEQEKINERAKRELEETKKLLAEYKNYKGVPMPESFKELGRKWGLR